MRLPRHGCAPIHLGLVAVSALAGALSHVFLDHFTHGWGFVAQHIDWYDAIVVGDALGRQWTVFRIVQYVGHVGGTALCIWLLARYGRERWMSSAAVRVEPFPVTRRSAAALALGSLAGLLDH